MKKFLALLLVLVIGIGAGIGGTVAYLTDTDSEVNVMTVGNVDIEQHEYQRAENVAYDAGEPGAGNGVKEGALVPFVQGQKLYPAYPAEDGAYTAEMDTEKLFFWGDYVYSGTAGNGLWNDAKLVGAMDKMVFVENTGKSDAYFRTIIAFECPEGMEYSQGSDKEFMNNVNGSDLYNWETVDYVTIDGVRYLVEVATYQKALKPGNQAHPSLLQVVMTHNAENEDVEKLGDTYDILVLSQACQVENLGNDAKTALDTAFGEVTVANVQEWFGDEKIPVVVDTAKELQNALKEDKDVVLTDNVMVSAEEKGSNGYGATGISVKEQTFDGAGHEIGVDAWATWDSAISTTGGTIKNVKVTRGMRGIFMPGATADVYIDNVVIDGTVYTFNSDAGNKEYGVYISNSILNGWTSHSDVHKEVVYTNCEFGEGQGYAYCRPYGPTTFVGCDFEAGFKVDAVGKVVFENCTIGGVALTDANIADLVTDTTKATVK